MRFPVDSTMPCRSHAFKAALRDILMSERYSGMALKRMGLVEDVCRKLRP